MLTLSGLQVLAVVLAAALDKTESGDGGQFILFFVRFLVVQLFKANNPSLKKTSSRNATKIGR